MFAAFRRTKRMIEEDEEECVIKRKSCEMNLFGDGEVFMNWFIRIVIEFGERGKCMLEPHIHVLYTLTHV